MIEPRKLICAGLLVGLIVLIQQVGVVIILPQNKLIFSFIVGSIGSAAYITVLTLRLIGSSQDDANKNPFMDRFSFPKRPNYYLCTWYVLMGGGIATVFQYDVDQFVAVQSLILGATWPAVISQFLSGRMTSLVDKDKDRVNEDIVRASTTNARKSRKSLVELMKEMEDNKK